MNKFTNWSRIGLGTGTLASLGRGTSRKTVCDLISCCGDLGVTVIDTADSYTSGKCEIMLGIALKGRRTNHILISKSGYRYGDLPGPLNILNPFIKKANQKLGRSQCFTPAYIIRNLQRSLQRLNTENLDCFLLHNPTLDAISDVDLLTALEGARQRGLTCHLGVSTDEPAVAKAAIDCGIFSVLQIPANPTTVESFSLVWRQATEASIHLMANHVFYSGKNHTTSPPPGMTAHEFLMKSVCSYLPQGTILVGTRNRTHLAANIAWAGEPL